MGDFVLTYPCLCFIWLAVWYEKKVDLIWPNEMQATNQNIILKLSDMSSYSVLGYVNNSSSKSKEWSETSFPSTEDAICWMSCMIFAFIPVLIHQKTCIWSCWWDSRGTEWIRLIAPVFAATKPAFNSLGKHSTKLNAGNSYPICLCHCGSLSVSWHRAHADNVGIETWRIWLNNSRLEKV